MRVSAPDRDTADRLARLLVEARLAACVQVLPGLTSTYRWEGAVETADEVLLLAKTSAAAAPALMALAEREHPYDVPEVLAVPVVAASDRYAVWLAESVSPPA
ncbi:MAG TPA: divalent-cation tolerance protein CutA [Dermatophilaceae bacterium]|nr:divalent-cation tolerance protein CutA [Dermatophilaceae bacterium]